jgi:hypothetical protein
MTLQSSSRYCTASSDCGPIDQGNGVAPSVSARYSHHRSGGTLSFLVLQLPRLSEATALSFPSGVFIRGTDSDLQQFLFAAGIEHIAVEQLLLSRQASCEIVFLDRDFDTSPFLVKLFQSIVLVCLSMAGCGSVVDALQEFDLFLSQRLALVALIGRPVRQSHVYWVLLRHRKMFLLIIKLLDPIKVFKPDFLPRLARFDEEPRRVFGRRNDCRERRRRMVESGTPFYR